MLESVKDYYHGNDKMGTSFYPDESYIFSYDCVPKTSLQDLERWNALNDSYKLKLFEAVSKIEHTKFEPQEGSTFHISKRFRNDNAEANSHDIQILLTQNAIPQDQDSRSVISNLINIEVEQTSHDISNPETHNAILDDSRTSTRTLTQNLINSQYRGLIELGAVTTYVTVNNDWITRIGKSIGSIGQHSQAIPRYRDAYKAEKVTFDGFLPLFHEEPSEYDKMGVWIPSWTKTTIKNECPTSANGILHYGYATLQQQPNFYNEPYSRHIWNLPGVKDEWLENKKPIDLEALHDEMSLDLSHVSYTSEESLKLQE